MRAKCTFDEEATTSQLGQPESSQVTLGAAVEEILQRLGRIESAVAAIVEQRTVKDWYTTEEFAADRRQG